MFLNIDNYLHSLNPMLITRATQSVCDRHHGMQGLPVQDKDGVNNHIKKVAQYFLLCQLLYCTTPQQPNYIHNILADVVEVCGGSRQLMRILNRFVTQHAETSRRNRIWNELPKHVFTVASVDNFDMLQSHSAVFCSEVTMEQLCSLFSQVVKSESILRRPLLISHPVGRV